MSPIRAEERTRYPKDWRRIADNVKIRANWRCECDGECGRPHVGRCPHRHGGVNPATGATIVLTVAHLNHTPEDCQPDNLKAMCQACHLAYDQDHHQETRRHNFEQARRVAGQHPLF